MTYKQRCLTCSHVVEPDGDAVGLIVMNNQPRYFHMSPQGCQNAERTPDLDVQFPEGRTEMQTEERFKHEKTAMEVN